MKLVMKNSPLLMLISLTLLIVSIHQAMAVPTLHEQAGALLAWKATLQSHPAQLQSWGSNSNTSWPPCSWYGINSAASIKQVTERWSQRSLYGACS